METNNVRHPALRPLNHAFRDVNNTDPTPEGAMSPQERRFAKIKKSAKTVKPEKKIKTAKPVKKEKSTTVKPTSSEPKKKGPLDLTGKVELKTICAELDKDPKAARRILRKSTLEFHTGRDRWVFTEKQAEKVREILRK